MKIIKTALMERDGISSEEADRLINSARVDLGNRLTDPETYGAPYNVCEDWFGLDPDLLLELL